MRRPSNELLRKNHSVPTGVSALASSDFSYMRYEYMRTARSHDRLPGGNEEHAMFKRTSSLADLAYIALPGLTSRVSRDSATVSLVHLSDAFSDMHPRSRLGDCTHYCIQEAYGQPGGVYEALNQAIALWATRGGTQVA